MKNINKIADTILTQMPGGLEDRGQAKPLKIVNEILKQNEKIPGGLAEGKNPKDFNQKQLQKGIKVEMEHTDDPKVAEEIAMDHLCEDKKYYDKLETIEKHD